MILITRNQYHVHTHSDEQLRFVAINGILFFKLSIQVWHIGHRSYVDDNETLKNKITFP